MKLRKRIFRAANISRVGAIAAVDAMANVFFSAEDRADFDHKIVDIIKKSMPELSTYIRDVHLRATPSMDCLDCRNTGAHFMLHDEVWNEAAPGEDGKARLCLWCVEKRLVRPLTIDDFKEVPLNNPIRYLFGLTQCMRKEAKPD